MIRRLLLYCTLSINVLHAQLPDDFSVELKLKIEGLPLKEMISEMMYEERGQCFGLVGINQQNERMAYLSVRYIGSGSIFHWTSFIEIPIDRESDKFQIEYSYKLQKRIFLHWSSSLGFPSMVGYYIQLRPEIGILRIAASRMSREALEQFLRSID